jgi:hypothetical protein
VILFWTSVALPGLIRDPTRANETVAVGSLRTINTVAVEYHDVYKNGFPPSLAPMRRVAEK